MTASDLHIHLHIPADGSPDTLHVHMHVPAADSVGPVLEDILTRVRAIEAQGERLMTAADEQRAMLAKIDQATSELGDRIKATLAKIDTGMSDEEVRAVNAELSGIADRLDSMAKDPAKPV